MLLALKSRPNVPDIIGWLSLCWWVTYHLSLEKPKMSFRPSIVLEWSSCLKAKHAMFVDRHNRTCRTVTPLRRVCGSLKWSCHSKIVIFLWNVMILLCGEVIDLFIFLSHSSGVVYGERRAGRQWDKRCRTWHTTKGSQQASEIPRTNPRQLIVWFTCLYSCYQSIKITFVYHSFIEFTKPN